MTREGSSCVRLTCMVAVGWCLSPGWSSRRSCSVVYRTNDTNSSLRHKGSIDKTDRSIDRFVAACFWGFILVVLLREVVLGAAFVLGAGCRALRYAAPEFVALETWGGCTEIGDVYVLISVLHLIIRGRCYSPRVIKSPKGDPWL